MFMFILYILLFLGVLVVRAQAPELFYLGMIVATITMLIFWRPVGILLGVIFFLSLKVGMD